MPRRPNTIYDLLDTIRERPGLYIARESATALRDYLHGYRHALYDFEIPFHEGNPPFRRGITEYVAAHFHRHAEGYDWSGILLEELGDESSAFDYFYKLLDEYRRSSAP